MCEKPVESRAYLNITGDVESVHAGWKSVRATNLHSMNADWYHYSAAGVYGQDIRGAFDLQRLSDVFFFGFWTDVRAPSQMVVQPHLTVENDDEVLVDEVVDYQQDWVFSNRTGRLVFHVPEVAYANGWLEMLFFAVDSQPMTLAEPVKDADA